MLKIRITYEYDAPKELNEFLALLEKKYRVLNQSKSYKRRGASAYSNIYIDIKKDDE